MTTNSRKKQTDDPAREVYERKIAAAGPQPLESLDHLAFAIMEKGGADVKTALEALSRLRREFIDWNEIRVTRTQELARQLSGLPNPEGAAFQIKTAYTGFFEKKGCLGFDFLASCKPQEAKRILGQALPVLPKGAQALLLFEHCPGSALPLSANALKQAKKAGVAGKNPDRNILQSTLSASLTPKEIALLVQCWEMEAAGHPYGPGIKSPQSPPPARMSGKGKAAAKPGKADSAGKKPALGQKKANKA